MVLFGASVRILFCLGAWVLLWVGLFSLGFRSAPWVPGCLLLVPSSPLGALASDLFLGLFFFIPFVMFVNDITWINDVLSTLLIISL